MAIQDGHRIIGDNLRLALQFFGRASGSGEITERNGVLLIDSGVDYAVFNIALITEPVEHVGQLELLVGTAAEWYGARHTRWSLWICDDLLALPARRHASEVTVRHRLRPLTQAPGMLAESLAPPSRYLPPMEYRMVQDSETRMDFAHLTTLSFDIPFTTSKAIYERPQAWDGDYAGYVGYVNRRAVCTVALVISEEAVGVYSVSTLPEYRRRGLAEALLRRVLKDAQEVSGLQRTILQSTRAGHEMYRRMGYREITNYSVHIL
jgi:GNAT superfamily N-acetyltransferase